MKNSRSLAAVTVLAITATIAWSESGTGSEHQKDPAVERARKSVKMLDDVYKTAMVLITNKYVHDEDDFPAGSAAIEWFDAISKKILEHDNLAETACQNLRFDVCWYTSRT